MDYSIIKYSIRVYLFLQSLYILRNLPAVFRAYLRAVGLHQVLAVGDHVEYVAFSNVLQTIRFVARNTGILVGNFTGTITSLAVAMVAIRFI